MATKRRRRTRRAAGLTAGLGMTLLALFATGCPEPGDLLEAEKYKAPVKEAPMTEACELPCVKAVFQENNTGCKACHATATPLGGLDLRDGYTSRLRDVAAKHLDVSTPADCPTGDKLIDTMNPSASWLLAKIHGTQKGCGTQMPLAPLNTEDMKCIENYVACVAGKPVTGGGGAGSGGSGGSGTAGAAAGSGGTAAGSGGAAAGSGGAAAGNGGAAAGSGGAAAGNGGGGGTGGT